MLIKASEIKVETLFGASATIRPVALMNGRRERE